MTGAGPEINDSIGLTNPYANLVKEREGAFHIETVLILLGPLQSWIEEVYIINA